MSSNNNVTNPTNTKTSDVSTQLFASPSSKGKSKAMDSKDHVMEEDEEEEEEEEEMGSDEESSDDEAEDDFREIDPSAIIPRARRTRGVRVDYTSKEALAKAGLNGNEDDESDDDDDIKMAASAATHINASPSSKGKAKAKDLNDHNMEEDEEEEEEEEEEMSDDEVVEDDLNEIDPSAIITQGRHTRGVRVDYTSKEALAKAGLQGNEDEDSDDDVEMKD